MGATIIKGTKLCFSPQLDYAPSQRMAAIGSGIKFLFTRVRLMVFLCSLIVACAGSGCSGHLGTLQEPTTAPDRMSRVEVLNALRNDINAHYGYRDGAPRINLGPCGPFARAFREQWNGRFDEQVNIAFIMSSDASICHHVLVKFLDGSYFDGGNGVMTENALMTLYPNSRIEEMKEFDLKLLDKWSYGLSRNYPECPDYSDDFTTRVIARRLAALPSNKRQQ